MKYNNITLTKRILILLLSVTLFAFASCESEIQESSVEEETSVVSEVPEAEPFSLEVAKELIERDETVIKMFICNSLYSGSSVKAASSKVSNSEFDSFDEVEAYLAETYSSPETIDFFLAYPNIGEPSLSDKNGATYAFNHIGSEFDDFIEKSTITVSETEDEKVFNVKAMTKTGTKVELTAVDENGVWLLTESLYSLLDHTEPLFDKNFQNMNLGSLTRFDGKILVIELFISDKKSEFSSEDESEFHNKVSSAVGFIKSESESNGNTVTVDYEKAYFDHSGVIGNRVLDFDIMFAETGFGTLQSFAEQNYKLEQYDNYFFAVCFNKEFDTSYSLYNNSAETSIYFAERVLLGNTSTASEICVSILKLMGAYAYNESKTDKYVNSLYNAYFANDIMLTEKIENSCLSPVTAYICGITNDLDPLYRVFYYE